MIDFTTLQGLTIPEGVVTQITDESGRVIWAAMTDEPIVLEVAKQTLTTYANETTYTDENFVLLDIYPKKSNSTVKVTYGGLTKTLTFSGTNAQQVFFGTFNGVTDSVATPASGTLTIEGGCGGFCNGTYKTYNTTTNKSSNNYCYCITAVNAWGGVTRIPAYALYKCSGNIASLPSGIAGSIGEYAFYQCKNLNSVNIPKGVTSIGNNAFDMCSALASVVFNEGLTNIGAYAFQMGLDDRGSPQTALKEIVLPSTLASIGNNAFVTPLGSQSEHFTYLKTVRLLSEIPPTIKADTFGSAYSNCSYIVPAGCGATYKAADIWNTYADHITEET